MIFRASFTAAAFFTLLTFLTMGFALDAGAQNIKLAQVSVDKVYKNSARVKAAEEDMKKIAAESTPRLDALKTEAEKIQAGLSAAKPEEREKLEKDYRAKVDEAQSLQQAVRAKLTLKQRSTDNAIKADIKEIAEKIAKQEGFTAVFMQEYVLYSGGMTDITDRVLKELDAKTAIESGK